MRGESLKFFLWKEVPEPGVISNLGGWPRERKQPRKQRRTRRFFFIYSIRKKQHRQIIIRTRFGVSLGGGGLADWWDGFLVQEQPLFLKSSSMVGSSKDVATLLEDDHRHFEDLLRRMRNRAGDRRVLLAEFAKIFAAHSEAEEASVYESLRQLDKNFSVRSSDSQRGASPETHTHPSATERSPCMARRPIAPHFLILCVAPHWVAGGRKDQRTHAGHARAAAPSGREGCKLGSLGVKAESPKHCSVQPYR